MDIDPSVPTPWRQMIGHWSATFSQPVGTFWRATPFEFWALWDQYFPPTSEEPLSADWVKEMEERHNERLKEKVARNGKNNS